MEGRRRGRARAWWAEESLQGDGATHNEFTELEAKTRRTRAAGGYKLLDFLYGVVVVFFQVEDGKQLHHYTSYDDDDDDDNNGNAYYYYHY